MLPFADSERLIHISHHKEPVKNTEKSYMLKKFLDLRLPLECELELTYRCNNNCRHCWLRIDPADPVRDRELSFDEIRRIVDESRSLGTRNWFIAGGEPMLRPDFSEIFEYITSKAAFYTLNTNGTLITPEIARQLRRKGIKMVALYGATKETYDHVTRNPGGFEQLMQGFAYLKEAGANFVVQIVPMRDNRHEWEKMKELATTLSDRWRVGASWLYLSSSRNKEVNESIIRQRLDPIDLLKLELLDFSYKLPDTYHCGSIEGDGRIFASCITRRGDFHVDPCGTMSFCSAIKVPSMRFDLRKGSVREGWEEFIPSLAECKFEGEEFSEYKENCGSCDLKSDCRWCSVYGWLEHGRFSAPVEYLCEIARETRRLKDEWKANHHRYYRIAGITISIESDLPITDSTFDKKFSFFQTDGAGEDTITIRHHFTLPDLTGQELGKEFYRKPPWAIFQQPNAWLYLGIMPDADDPTLHCVATFNTDHTRAHIYNTTSKEDSWRSGDLDSLTTFASDQILIARLLADRQGCYLHSAGAIINGAGVLFVGHSDAGKSTTTNFLIDAAAKGEMEVEILCDDRNIVRRMDDGWHTYGTWSHGDVPLVSSSGAPLRAICFIEQSGDNSITSLVDRREIRHRLLACVIRPFVTAEWWEKTLDIIERMSNEVSCYIMRFDKSGTIVGEIEKMVRDLNNDGNSVSI